MTRRFTRIASLHYTELNLATLTIYILEELIQPVEIFISTPQQMSLLLGQFIVRLVNREVKQICIIYQLLFPLSHRGTTPARHSIFVYGLTLIRHNQILIDADNLAIALTHRAGPNRVIETKQMLCRLLELYAISLKSSREISHIVANYYRTLIIAITICSGYRITHTQQRLVIIRHSQTVHDQSHIIGATLQRYCRHKLLYGDSLTRNPQTHKSVRKQLQQPLYKCFAPS